ncbi:MAG: Hpt domain-containing protein [Myxococcota bacterium]
MSDSESDFEIKLNALRMKYLNRCRDRVEVANGWLEQARSDSHAVQRLHAMAHEMAGSGATYGFPGITSAAAGIESLLEPHVTRGEALTSDERARELTQLLRELQDAIPQ